MGEGLLATSCMTSALRGSGVAHQDILDEVAFAIRVNGGSQEDAGVGHALDGVPLDQALAAAHNEPPAAPIEEEVVCDHVIAPGASWHGRETVEWHVDESRRPNVQLHLRMERHTSSFRRTPTEYTRADTLYTCVRMCLRDVLMLNAGKRAGWVLDEHVTNRAAVGQLMSSCMSASGTFLRLMDTRIRTDAVLPRHTFESPYHSLRYLPGNTPYICKAPPVRTFR